MIRYRNLFTAKFLILLCPLLAAGDPTVLQPVEELQATQVTDSTLVLSWSLPASMVNYLRQFEVCVVDASTSSGDCYLTAAYNLSWGSRDPLQPCSQYNVSVTWRSIDMTASNDTEIVVITMPQSVTELSTEEVGTTLFTVSWSLPEESSSCVSLYQVYLCTPSGSCSQQGVDIPQSTTSYTFENLQPCTSYDVVITSQAEDGSQSSNASLTVDTATQDPGPVQNLEVSQSGEGSVMVTWQAPEQQSCVSMYSVCGREISPEEGSNKCTEVRSDTNTDLTGLATCSVLNVSVTPAGADGQTFEAASALIDIGVPSSVTQLHVASKTTESVDVKWNEPVDNAACARGYSVCHRESFTQAELTCNNVTVMEYNISGLQTETSYDVYVAALGNVGSSPKYSIVRATTD